MTSAKAVNKFPPPVNVRRSRTHEALRGVGAMGPGRRRSTQTGWGVQARPSQRAWERPTVGHVNKEPGHPSGTGDQGADTRAAIREFLGSRRAKLSPEQVGLPTGGGRRRVAGLRREEVAALAGVSTEWYTRLERGHIRGVSDDVVDAVARALQLDEAERTYLFDLARAGRPADRAPRRRRSTVLPERIQWMLDSMEGSAAFVANGRMDVLAVNSLGRALYSPLFESAVSEDERRPVNIARWQYLDPSARDFLPDYEGALGVTAALLRTEAGRDPHNKELRELVGDLSTVSEDFRTRWAAHDVRLHQSGRKQFDHPVVGLVDVVYHSMDVSADGSRTLVMTVYTAEPGTDSEDRLKLLASWAATHIPA
jgi:transcriptional regulator with XRE-family HTH domain